MAALPRLMGASRKAAKPAAGRVKRRTRPIPATIAVSDEERRRLIEDVAYFHAARHRHVEPGQCREQDRCEAEAEIKTILERCRTR
jgi:hypothetical protein